LTPRHWSLTRRLTLWFVAGTTVIVLAVSWMSHAYLRLTVDKELDLLTESRIKELRARFQSLPESEADSSAFDAIAQDIADRTSEHRMAWRVWNLAWGYIEHEAGDRTLLTADYPTQQIKFETRSVPGEPGLRWRTEQLRNGFDIGVVLDGSSQITLVRQYEWLAALLLVWSAAGGALIGWFFLRRASDVLKRVADSARKVHGPAEIVDVDVSNAPDEIRDVVDALHELLHNIQIATERHRVLYASMAHELRAPIQNLVGATEVALMSRRDADSYRRVLESNLEELRELGDAIDNLMTICAPRATTQQTTLQEEFDVIAEARLRLERERARANRAGVGLYLETVGDTRMHGDRESVLRAIRNLVANAIDWSPRNGTVRVHIAGEEEQVEITVEDTGPGVPPDLRDKIFDPFYRGPTAHGRRVGYGLGLAIVKDAADRHGGTVVVDGAPGGGARFRLTLPRKRPVSQALPEPVGAAG
jgi:two-component system, OmpR family, heavy metal sensor histidine kinase CusS